jgi:hypothetical protein
MSFLTSRGRLAILLLSVCLAWTLHASTVDPADEVRSATVLMFLRMAEWHGLPAEGPIVIGVAGRPAFLQTLARTLQGKSVEKRSIRIVDLDTAPDPSCCHAIYIASDKPSDIRAKLSAKYSARALTIGESDRFLECGGAINLFLVDDRISFEANMEALARTGVSISSKLLRLGQIRKLEAGPR